MDRGQLVESASPLLFCFRGVHSFDDHVQKLTWTINVGGYKNLWQHIQLLQIISEPARPAVQEHVVGNFLDKLGYVS